VQTSITIFNYYLSFARTRHYPSLKCFNYIYFVLLNNYFSDYSILIYRSSENVEHSYISNIKYIQEQQTNLLKNKTEKLLNLYFYDFVDSCIQQ